MIEKLITSNFTYIISEFMVENDLQQKSLSLMSFFENPAKVNWRQLKQIKFKNDTTSNNQLFIITNFVS